MNKKVINKGFSTYASGHTGVQRLTDVELVKQDLINHIYTKKGDRVMHPEFGCIVWDKLFDPLDEYGIVEIEDDIRRIISSDPRLISNDIIVTDSGNLIMIYISFSIAEFEYEDELYLTFNREEQ